MDEMVDAMDRISELPCVIIHQIMSRLSTKEIAQTSILSKRWNRLRKSFPILDFDGTYFVGKDLHSVDFELAREDKGFQEHLEKFIKFVDASLLQFCEFNFRILRFRLYMILLDVKGSSPLVESWIQLALENKVEELDLEFVTHRGFPRHVHPAVVYTLPRAIFSANSVTALKLGGCRLELPSDTISFNSLKKLTLERIYITKVMLEKLIAQCPLLKDLSVFNCKGFTYLLIEEKSKNSSLENLFVIGGDWLTRVLISSERIKKLQFFDCVYMTRMVVHTPNLISFSYSSKHIPRYFSEYRIQAPCPWKVSFVDYGGYNFSEVMSTKELLRASKRIEDLSIYYNWQKAGYFIHHVNYNEIRKWSPSRPCEIENLSLYVDVSPSHYKVLLNNFLSICYPKTLSVMTCSDAKKGFSEWLYTQLRDRCTTCCNTHDIKCWRHYLNDVNIEKDPKPPNVNNLMVGWPTVSRGGICQFHLDWCLHAIVGKKRKLPKTKKIELPRSGKKRKLARN